MVANIWLIFPGNSLTSVMKICLAIETVETVESDQQFTAGERNETMGNRHISKRNINTHTKHSENVIIHNGYKTVCRKNIMNVKYVE